MRDHLIDAPELLGALGTVVVYDVRWRLGEPAHGREAYDRGHVPGAIFVDLDSDLSAPPEPEAGRHPLPDPMRFAGTLGRLGLTPGDHVVVYDDVAGRVAARMWWMLQAIGHSETRVLDGGFQAWLDGGYPISTDTVEPSATAYPTPPAFSGVVLVDQLEGRNLIDVRERERYEGESEPVDPIAGHIPGAINIPSSITLEDGRLKGPGDLAEIYASLEDPVMSCGSGVVACHSALALAQTGRAIPDVYVGSYSEWSRSGRPVRQGPLP